MRNGLEKALSSVFTMLALIFVVAFIRRQFYPPDTNLRTRPPQRIARWAQIVRTARWEGTDSAAIKIAVFSDLQCPFCKRLDAKISAWRRGKEREVAVLFLHYPLGGHPLALPAAIAAECAGEQQKFATFYHLVYQQQDSLGVKPWSRYASDAGIADTARFERCRANAKTMPAIVEGKALGDSIELHATPTVVVNGWRYMSPPDTADLTRLLVAERAGRDPFATGGASSLMRGIRKLLQ